jgi:hypothetical protein
MSRQSLKICIRRCYTDIIAEQQTLTFSLNYDKPSLPFPPPKPTLKRETRAPFLEREHTFRQLVYF